MVSSRVSTVDSTIQPSKSRLAVRIRKPIYSRVPGINNNRIVSSRVANSRLHLSTSDQAQIEPTKSQDNLQINTLASSGNLASNDAHHSTPLLESSLNTLDHSIAATSSSLPNPTTPLISSSPVDNSSKRRVVTVRKPLGNGFHRLRTRRPPFLASNSPDLISETEIASSTGPSSTARFSLYSRFTISHHHSSLSPVSSSSSSMVSGSSSSSVASSGSEAITPSSTIKQFPRVRLTSSRVIKSKSSNVLDKSISTSAENSKVTVSSSSLLQPISSVQFLSNANIQPTSASDMETRTMFTTFTYFTTFYQSGGQSKIVSSESTMSNVIHVPMSDLASSSMISGGLSSSISQPEQSFTLQSNIQATPAILPILITEHSERTETSTILNTITYFATLYNGTKSTITPIEEIKTELLTLKEPIKITRTIHPLVGGSLQSTQLLQSSQNEPRNVFVRTYYTTYTNPITLFNTNGGQSVSNVEEIVSNVSAFIINFNSILI